MTTKTQMPKDFVVRLQIGTGKDAMKDIAAQLHLVANLLEKGKDDGKIVGDDDKTIIGRWGRITRK